MVSWSFSNYSLSNFFDSPKSVYIELIKLNSTYNFNMILMIKQNVFRFEISMYYSFWMYVFQCTHNFGCIIFRQLQWQWFYIATLTIWSFLLINLSRSLKLLFSAYSSRKYRCLSSENVHSSLTMFGWEANIKMSLSRCTLSTFSVLMIWFLSSYFKA